MFSRKQFAYPENVSVEIKEKRAPTDESVKLLMEMQEAAAKSLVGYGSESLSVGEFRWTVMRNWPSSWDYKLHLEFHIDGRKCEKTIVLSKFEIMLKPTITNRCDEIQNRVRKAVAEAIEREISQDLFLRFAHQIAEDLLK